MTTTNDQRGTTTGTGFLIQCGLGPDLSIASNAISVSDSTHFLGGSGTLNTIQWAASNAPVNPSYLTLIPKSGSTWTLGTSGNIIPQTFASVPDRPLYFVWDGSALWYEITAPPRSSSINIYDPPYNARPGTDVTSIITSAIAALDAGGGGTLVIPSPHTFTVSNITISTTNPITITGGGTLSQAVGSALLPVVTLASNSITLDGISITGSIAAGHEADDGIACVYLTYISTPRTLDGITIRNCTLSGKSAGIQTYMGNLAFALTHLTIERNTIDCLHYGIRIGPWTVNAVVNDYITCEGNTVRVSAIGGYANFTTARAIQIINTHHLRIRRNFSVGGFSGIETYAGTGATSPRPRMDKVELIDNVTDGHLDLQQCNGGMCTGNIVDLALRDPSWPKYDDAAVVAAFGQLLPGIESADNTACHTDGNTVLNQVGEGIQFGGTDCTCDNNIITNSGDTSLSTANSHGIRLVYTVTDCTVRNNIIDTAKNSGIALDFDVSFLTQRTIVSGNKIRNVANHGIAIHYSNGDKIERNEITLCNQPPSGYNAIDFTSVVFSDVVQSTVIRDNHILDASGTYAIYQPYYEPRTNIIEGNYTAGAITPASPFNAYGRRRRNIAIYSVATPSYGLSTGHLALTHLQDNFVLDPGALANFTFIDGGGAGDEITVRFARADTTVVNSANMILAGGVNVTPTANSMMTFVCILDTAKTAQIWQEKSRMIA